MGTPSCATNYKKIAISPERGSKWERRSGAVACCTSFSVCTFGASRSAKADITAVLHSAHQTRIRMFPAGNRCSIAVERQGAAQSRCQSSRWRKQPPPVLPEGTPRREASIRYTRARNPALARIRLGTSLADKTHYLSRVWGGMRRRRRSKRRGSRSACPNNLIMNHRVCSAPHVSTRRVEMLVCPSKRRDSGISPSSGSL